jgi:hypothetical protein
MKILVEVTEEEAALIGAAMRAITEGTMRALAPELIHVNNQRLADRFEIAATAKSGDHTTLIGQAIVIGRTQDPV